MTVTRWVASMLLPPVTAAALLGCASRKAGLDSDWPRADRERTVAGAPVSRVWPLTGLPAPDPSRLRVRPVLVALGAGTAWQGLDAADVLFEMPTGSAGAEVRALFHSFIPKAVGPVGPATASDVRLASAFGASLAYAGARPSELATGPGDGGQAAHQAAYGKVAGSLLVDADALVSAEGSFTAAAPFAFSEIAAGATRVAGVSVPYGPSRRVGWSYVAVTRTYARTVNGKVPAGAKPRVVNVVVLWAPRATGPAGAVSIVGSGQVSVFSGGRKTSGSWEATGGGPPALRDESGRPLPLAPGKTWIQVVPVSLNITLR